MEAGVGNMWGKAVKEVVQYHYLLLVPLGSHGHVVSCDIVVLQCHHDLDIDWTVSV